MFEIYLNYYGVITDIDVPYDDDWYPAFQATTDMKSWIDENIIYSEKEETVQNLEYYLKKGYYQFDGKDLCLIILNVNWIGYY